MAFGFALLCGFLISAETAARHRWGTPPPEDVVPGSSFDYFHLQIHKDFFKKERQQDGTDRYVTQRDRTGGKQSFPARKETGVFRVFVFGGSVAMNFNSSEKSRLGEFLGRSVPGRRFEIVGCGMGGYDSYRESLLQKELLRHQPDLLVLLSGNNEYADPLRIDPRLYRLNLMLRKSALYRGLQDALFAGKEGPALTLDDRLRGFRENLELMAARARRRGVPLVLCTLPVNIRDIPPTSGYPAEADPLYARAKRALDRGDDRKALADFRAYVRQHGEDPYGHFWLARALEASGAPDEARAEYLAAVDRDDPGERCSPRRNLIIRAMGGEPGVVIADVEERFARLVPHGLLDARVFKDQVHWQDEFYPLVSLVIIQALAAHDRSDRDPILSPSDRWTYWWNEDVESKLGHPVVPPANRRRYAEEVFFTALSQIFARKGRVESAVSYFEIAQRFEPGLPQRFLRSPQTLRERIDSNPWLEHLRGRFERELPRVKMHVDAAARSPRRP